jgi:hypothetical protein
VKRCLDPLCFCALFIGDYVLTKRTESAASEFTDEQLQAIHAQAMAADNAD